MSESYPPFVDRDTIISSETVLPAPPEHLCFGQVHLRLERILPGDSDRGFVPFYHFRIHAEDGTDVGHINFRVGDTDHIRLFAGHIGYEIKETSRGQNYAYQACGAIAPFIRTQYECVTITCDSNNFASQHIIEKLGAVFVDELLVHSQDPLDERGLRNKRRYIWTP